MGPHFPEGSEAPRTLAGSRCPQVPLGGSELGRHGCSWAVRKAELGAGELHRCAKFSTSRSATGERRSATCSTDAEDAGTWASRTHRNLLMMCIDWCLSLYQGRSWCFGVICMKLELEDDN